MLELQPPTNALWAKIERLRALVAKECPPILMASPVRHDVKLTLCMQAIIFSDSLADRLSSLRLFILEDRRLPSGIMELEVRHARRT